MLHVIVADHVKGHHPKACTHAGQSLANQHVKPIVHNEHERNGLSEECSAHGESRTVRSGFFFLENVGSVEV